MWWGRSAKLQSHISAAAAKNEVREIARDVAFDKPRADLLEPWPPPAATRSSVYVNIKSLRPDLKTVGDFALALQKRLNEANYYELRYWGAPNGFALLNKAEPIDQSGRRIETSRPSQDSAITFVGIAAAMKTAIVELGGSPIGDSRMFLFVLTDDGNVNHPDATMNKPTADRWYNKGKFTVPELNSDVQISAKHLAAVFVYRFHKDGAGQVKLMESDPMSVEDQLITSHINIDGLLK